MTITKLFRTNCFHRFLPLWSSRLAMAILLMLSITAQASGQTPLPENPRFTQVGNDENLISNTINAMAQDQNGLMWFATEQGLVRYDGYDMQLIGYHPDDDERHIGSPRILSLLATEDALWLGADQLIRFDFATETVKRFALSGGMGISAITMDTNGKLWLGGFQFGLQHFDPASEELIGTHFNTSSECAGDDGRNIINDLHFDSDDILWLATSNGVCQFNTLKNTFSRPANISGTARAVTTSLNRDRDGRFWIGSDQGLLVSDEQGAIKRYYRSDLANGFIKSLRVDSQNRVWVGLDKQGLLVIDAASGNFRHIAPHVSMPYSLAPGGFFSIFEDERESIWFAVKGFGLYRYDADSQLFDLFPAQKNTPGTLRHPLINAMTSDSGSLWVATDGGGLFKMNKSTRLFTAYSHNPELSKSLPSNSVIGLSTSRDGAVWVGTWAGGLSRLDPESSQIQTWHAGPESGLWTNNIFTLFTDSQNRLWVSSWDFGVQVFDPESLSLIRSYRGNPQGEGLRNVNVMAMAESRDGGIWLGGYSGLDYIDAEGHHVERIGLDPEDGPLLSGGTVFSVHEDDRGIVWIGTDVGLTALNRSTGNLRYYKMADGLPGNAIYGILEDADGDIWLSTNRGLALLYRESGKIRKFSTADGLQSHEFNRFSYHQSNGEFYFGGINGFNRFDPMQVKLAVDSRVNHIVLTDLVLANQIIRPGQHKALPKALSSMDTLTLSPSDSVFGIRFAAPTFSYTKEIDYRYRLEGFDQQWLLTNSDNRLATYTRLPSGHYIFRVQPMGMDNTPLAAEASIRIHILPHWWETPVFLIFCIGLFIAILGVIYNYRVKSMMRRMELQQKEREAALYLTKNRELEALNQQLVAMGRRKDDLLGIVAHDLRNPLAALKLGLELMIEQNKIFDHGPAQDKLERLKSSVLRMIGIADKLLSDRDDELIAADFGPVKVHYVVQRILNQNSNIAATKNIRLHLCWQTDRDIQILADETLLSQALDNLISNAIKFSYPDSSVSLLISADYEHNTQGAERNTGLVRIKVRDEGQGMTSEDLKSAFRRNTRLSASPTQNESSHGMGLYIVHKVMEVMHGRVSVNSDGVNQGCEFTLEFPHFSGTDTECAGNEHLQPVTF